MSEVLSYGHSSVRFELPPQALLAHCGADSSAPIDAAAQTRGVLHQPLDFPPLAEALVPGDKVVIALGDDLPEVPQVVSAAVEYLLETGRAPDDITLLRTRGSPATDDWRDALLDTLPGGVRQVIHDPERRADLAFLAATRDHMPILLNRALIDADFVVPIGCLRLLESAGYNGACGVVCPTFSDTATQQRFRGFHAAEGPGEPSHRGQVKAEEVFWLLGVSFLLLVVPSGGAGAAAVLGGKPQSVARQGQKRCAARWRFTAPCRAPLVIAAIAGGPSEQTWDNVGRAACGALGVLDDGGSLVLCSELSQPPGPALARLASEHDRQTALRWIRKERACDVLAAVQLSLAMDRGSVYLLSQLPDEDVESLGMAPLAGPAEAARLAAGFDSCILIDAAQYAGCTVGRQGS